MNPLIFLFIFLLSFLGFTQNAFAINNKRIPDNTYTEQTLPQTSDVRNYCILFSDQEERFVTIETDYFTNVFLDKYFQYSCKYNDNGLKYGTLTTSFAQTKVKDGLPAELRYGCKDPKATNYNPNVIYHIQNRCTFPSAEILGCTDPTATNYNSQANKDDGSCILPPPPVAGCTDPTAINYNILANQDDGSCVAKVEGCTDSTALNYNPSANVHVENTCQYPPKYVPTNITGYIETSQVQKGATQWNIKILTSHTGTNIDTSRVQLWNRFTVVDSSVNDKTITLSLRQFDDQRLDVECTNYEITVPTEAITTTQGDINSNPITGNFSVTGCDVNNTNPQNPTNPTDTENTQTGVVSTELNQQSQYLSILAYKDGHYLVDIKAISMLFFFILLSFSIFYVIFKFFNKKIP